MLPPFSKKEIDALPTILDVVEMISSAENKQALHFVEQVPSPQHLDEGRYSFVSDRNDKSIVRLMPMSQSPFKYYRGQSRYHAPCVPSLFRGGQTPEDIASNCIKVCEFTRLLRTHPVFCVVAQNTKVNPVALAQHYGLSTEYLDITNSKWVAAFFASTGYDWESDTYYPVGRDYEEGFGVMYISKDYDAFSIPEEFFDKNGVIGYQYFTRPTKQSSFGYGMDFGEDFNESPYFDKVFFRHDLYSSQIVYEMSYRQKRFIPIDSLSILARRILLSDEVTRDALIMCWSSYYNDIDPSFLDDVCRKKGWKIREDSTPLVQFSEEELERSWNEWNVIGRADIESRTLPIVATTVLEL